MTEYKIKFERMLILKIKNSLPLKKIGAIFYLIKTVEIHFPIEVNARMILLNSFRDSFHYALIKTHLNSLIRIYLILLYNNHL